MRVVLDPAGRLEVGRSRPGRGAWLCAGSPACLEQAAGRRAFDRAFRRPVAPEAVQALAGALGTPAGPAGAEVGQASGE